MMTQPKERQETIRISSYTRATVKNKKDRQGAVVSLDATVQRIRNGTERLAQRTIEIRKIHATGTHEAYRQAKARILPAATFSGVFTIRDAEVTLADKFHEHAGILTFDIDNVKRADMRMLKIILSLHPNVILAFDSPSYEGIKTFAHIDPIPTTESDLEHKYVWSLCKEMLDEKLSIYGYQCDSGDDPTRLCFLTHDPDVYYDPSKPVYSWDREAYLDSVKKAKKSKASTSIKKENKPFTGETDIEALNYVPNDCPYEVWRSIGMAIKDAGFSVDVFQTWSGGQRKSSSGEWVNEDIQAHWNRYKRTAGNIATWGTVVHIAMQNGYTPKRNHKPIRLGKKKVIESILEPLKESRKILAEAFENEKKFIGVRADTGVGKTEQAETYYFKGYRGFFSTPTGDLAKEIYARFEQRGLNVFLWRGIASNPDGKFPHEKPCEFPAEYIALVEKGRNAYKVLCESCPFRETCDQHGYRSQEEKAKEEDVIVAAHKDLLLNPSFRTTAKRLLPSHSDDLIVVDEFEILESFLNVSIPQARLEYLRDTWYDHPLGELAKKILDACVVQNAPFTGISHSVELLSDNERQQIIKALGQLRIGDIILDTDVAEEHENKTGQTSGLEKIQRLPVLEPHEDWNTLIKLELFFDVYKHAESAPIAWEDNTLTFHIPPLPHFTRSRVILMSATLNETFFRQVFKIREEKRGDVDFLDLENTEWHPDARVYQLRTNRNPRRTLLEGEQDSKGHWQYTPQLTQTGQAYLDKIKASIETSDKKSGFIGHKMVIDNHTDDIDAATGHFGGLVGLNQHFHRDKDEGIRLHILGTPNIGQEALETACKLLLGMTESSLDFTRNDDGTYSDPNVQTVADAIVQSELTQAVGRAGLVKNPSEVIIWSSYEIPSISYRKQTLHLDECDWIHAGGDLDALPDAIAEREAHEKAVTDAVEKGDTKAVAKLKGVSERHARRINQKPRQKNKKTKERRSRSTGDSTP